MRPAGESPSCVDFTPYAELTRTSRPSITHCPVWFWPSTVIDTLSGARSVFMAILAEFRWGS
jgi:hypothetical protein